mmetsp:Transcript_13549/g.19432  ORF Transcript_13549/g.19432 Transcript_13549/m.19432 type:complete len:241 (+) Transcript_13549:50-772(+)
MFMLPSSEPPNGYDRDPVHTEIPTNSIAEDDSSPQWYDTFFDDDEDVIEVFDFDYPLMVDFGVKSRLVKMSFWLFWFLFFEFIIEFLFDDGLYLAFALSAAFIIVIVYYSVQLSFLKSNVSWGVYSQHLCVTRDGIHFVQDKRKSCFGWACTDKGKTTKTVPFDKITECNILLEPAGNTCCCVTNVLSTIKVDTASNGVTVCDLVITGLKDPYRFKKLVCAMKGSTASNATVEQVAAPMV